ncbi:MULTISPECIES: type II toxin-antitoxin system VapC family toxin [Pelosinus]|uniref:PilT protein domain protein n=1 Tax=Pelosinus fermentans B4 TaxID=1149862 RepID=I9B6Y8_9FIRM|nr:MULTISPECIES: PIN domain-containing protein [Pelosinus]EIW20882.1 PilT protein domain protein [Pelosinus fermentans B4]EIW27251.1 PilT protein domain protein [Pelosinus fermentans A11]
MTIADFLKVYKKIGFDTNIFIAVFAQEPIGARVLPIIDAVGNKETHEIWTSVLAFSECSVRPYREANWNALDQVKLMFQMPNLTAYHIDEEIAEEAAKLRAAYNVKMPDALIAATAIVKGADVLLTNDYELSAIREISVVRLDELCQ